MKKITVLLIMACLTLFQAAYAKDNTIYELDLNRDKATNEIQVAIKGDYKENIETVKENANSVYFDIKNAKLSDAFKTDLNEDLSIVSQQIGSKVRIYLKGENLDKIHAAFNGGGENEPVDFNKIALMGVIMAFIALVAKKGYSAKIKLSSKAETIKIPMRTAANLNRQLYDFGKRKRPEIVLNASKPMAQSNVYVDFEYAKNRKNIKIAI